MSSGVAYNNTVPDGQHAPFAAVTDDDHRAWIIIAAAMGIAFTSVALLTRIFIRQFVNLGWALDDYVAVAATLIFFIQCSLVLGASADGLGKSIDLIPVSLHGKVQQLYYTSNIFYILALDASKWTSLSFFRRITPPNSFLRKYCTILGTVLPVFTIGFILATALQCDLLDPWNTIGQSCPGWIIRWDVQGALSSAWEIALFIGPCCLIWGLQRPLETKLEVISPFALRLFIIPFTIVRLSYFDQSGLTTDPTLAEALYITLTQAELGYAVMSTTFPTARRFASDLITYYSGVVNLNTSSNMSGLRSGRSGRNNSDTVHLTPLRKTKYSSQVSSGSGRSPAPRRMAKHGSQELIIRKDFTVEVAHDVISEAGPSGRASAGPSSGAVSLERDANVY